MWCRFAHGNTASAMPNGRPKSTRSCGVEVNPCLCAVCSLTPVPLIWAAQPDVPPTLLFLAEASMKNCVWQSAQDLFVLARQGACVQVQALPAAADGPGRATAGCLILGPSSRGTCEPASLCPAGGTGRPARLRPPGSGVRGSAGEHQDTWMPFVPSRMEDNLACRIVWLDCVE